MCGRHSDTAKGDFTLKPFKPWILIRYLEYGRVDAWIIVIIVFVYLLAKFSPTDPPFLLHSVIYL